jgi:hypothetical protein
MNSKSQILIYDNASSDNFDFDHKKIHYIPIDSIIHYFFNVPKIMIILLFCCPKSKLSPFNLFKDKHLEQFNFLTLFYM